MSIPAQLGSGSVPLQSPWSTAHAQPAAGGGSPASAKARHAMQELEAQILGNWLDSLQKAFSIGGSDEDKSVSENYRYLTTQALAEHVAQHGGLGISAMLLHALHLEDGKKDAHTPNVASQTADGNQ